MSKLSIRDIDLANKRVFIRVDFNVPLTEDGSTITDDTRIVATLPTIVYALQRKAKVILASHLGRPKGKPNPKYSLRPVVVRLRELLDKKLGESINVAFSPDCIGEVASEMARQLESGQVLLLENLRYHPEEEANDPAFSKALASLADLYVNDAFGSAHRPTPRLKGLRISSSQPSPACSWKRRSPTSARPWNRPKAVCRHHRGSQNLRQDRRYRQPARQGRYGWSSSAAWRIHSSAALGVTTGKSLVEEDKIDMAKAALDKAKAKGVELLLP